MFKREMKINLKSFIIWTSILIGLFLVVFLVYPSIVNSENMEMMDEMMKMFPEEMLKAFNMDISSINSAFGWLKTEGFVFVLLITGIYSGILGSNILLKEESDKTIEYLNSVPVTRKNIVVNKILCGLLYIILMIAIIGIFNFIGLSLSGEFDRKSYKFPRHNIVDHNELNYTLVYELFDLNKTNGYYKKFDSYVSAEVSNIQDSELKKYKYMTNMSLQGNSL